ncbi:GNAT family N-acetyltransferase, partial [Pseudomonas aeruginosa]
TPCFLARRRAGRLAGAVPLYAKSHSRGEYVFDYAWADAYARNGLPYYPKLLSAVPFTPVGGARLLAHTHADRLLLARGLIQLARQFEVSSLHVLFPSDDDLLALREAGYLIRAGVQFHWRNAGYAGFDDFLAAFSHDKRKKIRQDRKKVAAERVSFRWLRGADIDAAALDFFYQCYRHTYLAHGNPPYLNLEFFRQLHAEMPDALVLILAEQDGQPVAAALNLQADGVLYGRYWGARRYIPGLHFETCYLQSIEYCIAHGQASFEGGAQGEHKMARGLLPTPTWSAHWIADRQSGPQIRKFGSEAQRSFYLPRICRGEAFFCIGMSEPNSGSDLASVGTRATRRADGGWTLSGRKIWTTNAQHCHYMIALVRTSGTPQDRNQGLSQFIVDLSLPGVTVRPISDLAGDAHFSEVFFDDVQLSDEALIGQEGSGWEQVTAELAFERSGPERIYSSMVLLDGWIQWLRGRGDVSQTAAVGRYATHLAALRNLSLSVACRRREPGRGGRPGQGTAREDRCAHDGVQEGADRSRR